MSSSPDDSASITSPASDTAPTTNTTVTSGFTAVNGRHTPLGISAQTHGVNGHLKMESASATSPYDLEAARNANPVNRASPARDTDHAVLGSPGKRRRSDEARDPSVEQGVYSADKRRTPPQPWSDAPAQGMQRLANHQTTHPLPGADPKDAHAWYGVRQQRAESPSSDARLAEALQRENGSSLDAHHIRQHDAAVMDHHIGGTPQHQITSTTETTAAGVQVDPKKRKRVFSNRTKTGCQTCRKRKKKCDEGKPECSNCTRGGFVCEGYTNKSPWQKPLHSKGTPVALQSKDSYSGDTGGLMPRPSRDGYHTGGQMQMHSDGQRTRPINLDEDRPRSSWGNSSWETPSRPYLPDRNSSLSFQTGTPVPDLTRPQASYESRVAAQEQHHMAMTAHGQLLQQHVENLPNEMGKRNEELNTLPQLRSHPVPANMASTAQLALQQAHHMTSSSPAPQSNLPPGMRTGRATSEKDKMISQQPFAPYAEVLVHEREACSGATYRFNNSQNPSTGVSREERFRLFRQILEPQQGDLRRSQNPLHTGSLGQGVIVEAPFNCSYGYNIRIGDSTSIGRNCTIHDPVLVSIGANCRIGPNVDIYAAECIDDASAGRGTNGLEIGKQVEIEDNVIIEGRCIIKAGVRIKTGSVIKAGSIVDKGPVPAHVIYGPQPGHSEVIEGKWGAR